MGNTGIYKITNVVNGKIYIGSAKHFAQRWGMHLFQLRRGTHHSILLQREFDKYGEQSFVFTKLIECEKEDLIVYEQWMIDELHPCDTKIGYNICETAGSSAGRKMTEKALALQRVRMKGNTHTLGFRHSEEAKLKMSKSRMGNKFSVGKRNWLGKKHSEETKARLSEVAKNRPPMSLETKEKIRQSMILDHANHPRTLPPISEETREKMRQAHLGKNTAKKGTSQPPHSEETKRKMSEARKLWHAKNKEKQL